MSQMMLLGAGSSGPGGGVSIIGFGSSLVGRWFIGNALTDLSGNGNTATLVGSATYDTDIPTVLFPATHSLLLTSDGDYAHVGNSTSLNPAASGGTGEMSLSVWVRIVDDTATGMYFGRGGGSAAYSFGNVSSSRTVFTLIAGTIPVGAGQRGADTWTHCAVTGSAANGWIQYINGVATGSGAWIAPNASASNTEIGRGENNNALTAVGRLFDPRIYNVELSAAQVALIAAGNG